MKPVKLSDTVLRLSLVFLAVAMTAVSGYAIAVNIRRLGDPGIVNELESIYTTNAGLFILIGLLSLCAIWPACRSSKVAIRTTFLLAIIIAIVTLSATLVYLARHLKYKDGIQAACAIQPDSNALYPIRRAACAKEWNRGIGYKVAYVILTLFFSAVAIEAAWLRLRRDQRARAALASASQAAAGGSSTSVASGRVPNQRDAEAGIELAEPPIETASPSSPEDKPAPPKYEETAPAYSRVV